MKTQVLFFIILANLSILSAQNSWNQYTTTNGLSDNTINDVLIEDQNNIWLATQNGLSHFNGTNFTNYYSTNSSINNSRIKELAHANGKLYMVTDSGLSELSPNGNFVNYTTANGLLNNAINGIAVDLNGHLWIGTSTGVSKFDGSSFTNYPTKIAYDIEVDSSNRVYILRYNTVFNIPSFPQAIYEVFSGGTWSSPSLGPFSETFSSPKLKKARNGQMVLLSGLAPFYAKLSYPFNLEVIRPEVMGVKFQTYRDIEIDLNGNTWIAGLANGDLNVFQGQDSLFQSLNLSPLGLSHNSIDINDGKVVSGSQQGFFIAPQSIQPVANQIEIDINSIRTSIDVNGVFFNNTAQGRADFEFPKGNNSYGIYSANLVVAAKSIGDSTYTANPLSPYVYSMRPGPVTNGPTPNASYILKVSKAEINQHKIAFASSGYNMPHGIKNWPANGDSTLGIANDLAPFFDVNTNGCYDPENGDYPAILGDEAIYWINNPLLNRKHLEYHGMLYGFNSSNPALNQVLFLKYRIINRSNQFIDSLKAGFYMDADVGNSADDYVGCDSLNNIAYAYNGDAFDESVRGESGFGSNPPAVGVKYLSDNMDSHLYYNIGAGLNGDPSIAQHWVNYLSGKWQNGTPAKFGGNGLNSPGTISTSSKYMFTGDPYLNSGWTESQPGGSQSANLPGDRRSISSIPFFSLAPGAAKIIDLAIGYGLKDSISIFSENVPELISILNQSKSIYDTFNYSGFVYGTSSNCITTSLAEEPMLRADYNLKVYPNPSTGDISILSQEGILQAEVYDLKGSRLFSAAYSNQNQVMIHLPAELGNGLYILKILDEKRNWKVQKLILQR